MKAILLYLVLFEIVLVRFFTESLGIFPRALNFGDIALLFVCALVVIDHYLVTRKPSWRGPTLTTLALLFVLLAALSTFVNAVLYQIELLPAGAFLIFYLEPILFALFLVNLDWTRKDTSRMLQALVVLALVQIPVGLGQIPTALATGNPDLVAGTFGLNGSQMGFFLFLVGSYMLGRGLLERRWRWFLPLPFFMLLFYVNGFKAMWVALPLTLILLLFFFAPLPLGRKLIIVGITILLAVGLAVTLGAQASSSTVSAFGDLERVAWGELGKVRIWQNFVPLFSEAPFGFLLGVGPGSYASRAFQTFSQIGSSVEVPQNVARGFVPVFPVGEFANQFVVPLLFKDTYLLGSWTIDGPFSSYVALVGEVGVVGTLLYLCIYAFFFWSCWRVGRAAWKTRDAEMFGVALAGMGGIIFLAQMALWDVWLEVSRVVVPLWLFAIPILSGRLRIRTAGYSIALKPSTEPRALPSTIYASNDDGCV